jgi:hypothetical protein
VPEEKYLQEIEGLLKKIPELERAIEQVNCQQAKMSLNRHLKKREKRLEHLTPFRFRLELRKLCQSCGIQDGFIT